MSSVQTLASSQSSGGPPVHAPPEQVSPVVHALPSLHGLVLLVCTQPVDGSQESSVQPLLSSQFGGGPPMQMPFEHVSFVVHALPSSHDAVLLVCTHPDEGSHESSVQPLLSLQFGGVLPVQTPAVQTSTVVQALPSLHVVPLGLFGFEHWPVDGSHVPAS